MLEDRQLSNNSVYRNFAENLHRLVARKGTITQACVGMGLNRQQFNKYINGSVLPNEATMGKILSYLGVDLPELFRAAGSKKNNGIGSLQSGWLTTTFAQETLHQLNAESSKSVLREGLYLSYCPWPPDEKYCIRALIILRRIDGHLFFTRLVRANEYGSDSRKYKSRLQHGVVTQWKNFITMIGHQTNQVHRKTMLTFVFDDERPNACMSGLISSYSPFGQPICSRALLHYEGSSSGWRGHFKNGGMLPIGHESIRKDAAALIAEHLNPKIAVLESIDLLKDWRR
jgi:transcriptional regulator with XRE-family HTH domain